MFSGLTYLEIFVLLISLIISITLHEAMHGYVAHWLGDDTAENHGRLTLNPLKSIDLYTTILLPMILIALGAFPIMAAKPVPVDFYRLKFEEYGMALVGLAGPLTNFALAALAGIVLRFNYSSLGYALSKDLLLFIETNVALFVFNMIPFPPLDGSRVLYAFAPESLRKFMTQIESYGFLSILLLFIVLIQVPAFSQALSNIESGLIHFLV